MCMLINKHYKEARSYISVLTVLVIVFIEVTSSVTREGGGGSSNEQKRINQHEVSDRSDSNVFQLTKTRGRQV